MLACFAWVAYQVTVKIFICIFMEGNEALPDAPEDVFMEDVPPQPPPQHPHPILLVNPPPPPSPPAQPLLPHLNTNKQKHRLLPPLSE